MSDLDPTRPPPVFRSTDRDPVPVAVASSVPIPVVVTGTVTASGEIDAPATTTAEQDRQTAGERLALRTAPPRTTEEQDRTTAGQRLVNLMWESTQRQIAIAVIGASLLVALILAVGGKVLGTPDIQLAAVVFLFGVANLVTGFYFGRTNHARTGGVGGDKVTDTR